MAQDATGTPTAKGIPKINTAVDAPSGKGHNSAMDVIDTLLDSYVLKPASIATGEVPVWNGSAFARSSVTRISTVRPQDLQQDGAATNQALVWNGSIWAPGAAGGTTIGTSDSTVTVSNTASETNIADITIDSSMFVDGRRIVVRWWGDWLHNNTSGDSISYIVRTSTVSTAGTGTIFANVNHAYANQVSATRATAVGWFEILVTASGNAICQGRTAVLGTAGASSDILPSAVTLPTSLGSDTHLKLSVQNSAASTNLVYRLFGYRAVLYQN